MRWGFWPLSYIDSIGLPSISSESGWALAHPLTLLLNVDIDAENPSLCSALALVVSTVSCLSPEPTILEGVVYACDDGNCLDGDGCNSMCTGQ